MKKLVLFDIDGTIVLSPGLGRKALIRAIEELYGTDINYDVSMAGQTDPLILFRMLEKYINPDEQNIDSIKPVFDRYYNYLQETFTVKNGATLIDGVKDFIIQGHEHQDVVMGLLTGNIEKGGYWKISIFSLDKYFPFGAFGNEAILRKDLPDIAVSKAKELTGKLFSGKDVVIIGDTHFDVLCGKHLGTASVAIISTHSDRDEIMKACPDIVLESFNDQEEIWNRIIEL